MSRPDEGLAWQTGVWDRISDVYARDVDPRFAPIVDHCLRRADLVEGQSVLDLGTGTGAVAASAAALVGTRGRVVAVDLSPEMLALARGRVAAAGLANVEVCEGRAEAIPAGDAEFDAVVASLSLMYALDRRAAARECARVLRPGGRFVAAVWAGPAEADIVRFQQTAGAFAPPPPVPGVGPGALADPEPFVAELVDAGFLPEAPQSEVVRFAFDEFEQAWEVLAGVTTADLDEARRDEAKRAVQEAMWPDPASPRVFENRTQFVVATRRP